MATDRLPFSVIILSRNDADQLGACLQAVAGANMAPEQVIVVNHGQSEDAADVAQRFAAQGVAYLRCSIDDRVQAAKFGARTASSNYICFLRGSERIEPFFFESEFLRIGGAPSRAENSSRPVTLTAALERSTVSPDGLLKTIPFGRMLLRESVLNIQDECVTFFIALAGRFQYWDKTADFLARQTYDRNKVKLVLMDTSQDPEFSKMIREWLLQSGYPNYRYIGFEVGSKGLADKDRIDGHGRPLVDVITDVRVAMARIYNRLRRMVETPFVLVLEDDVAPPLDICERLRSSMTDDTASVCGPYRHRYEPGFVAWSETEQLLQGGRGVAQVGGNGFGCVLLRTSVLRDAVFTADPACPDFDKAFYRRLNRSHIAKIDWTVECEHLSPMHEQKTSWPEPEDITEENFDEDYYLRVNPDVRVAVLSGKLPSGFQHYKQYGKAEKRAARSLH